MIEPLEARIAPAAFVTYTDIDGDLVKITASKGPLDAAHLLFVGSGTSGQLRELILTDTPFAGANITFSVTKQPGGDGLAHVGHVNATGVDLGAVVVKGDLAEITAGDATLTTAGVKSLTVRSMGVFGAATGAAAGAQSVITGGLGSLKIAGDFRADLRVSGTAGTAGTASIGGDLIGGQLIGSELTNSGNLSFDDIRELRIAGDVVGGSDDFSGFIRVRSVGLLSIGGDLIGGAEGLTGGISVLNTAQRIVIGGDVFGGSANLSGRVLVSGDLGSLLVKGSLRGGSQSDSGTITLNGESGMVTIKGSIIGGAATTTGLLQTKDLQTLRLGGSIIGGSAEFSGVVKITETLGTATIGGSLVGGRSSQGISTSSSGVLEITGDARKIMVVGDLIGSGLGASQISSSFTGAIRCSGRIGAMTVAGSLVGGWDASMNGTLFGGGSIFADNFGVVKIGGDVLGNPSGFTGIVAEGLQAPVVGGVKLAIGRLTIGGDVSFATIAAGLDNSLASTNADASIGPVRVVGDWIASNLVAGARDSGNDGFGRNDALSTGTNDPALVARIASVVIRGIVTGTDSASDHFGIVAQEIGPVMVAGTAFAAASGTGTLLSPVTADVRLLLVS